MSKKKNSVHYNETWMPYMGFNFELTQCDELEAVVGFGTVVVSQIDG